MGGSDCEGEHLQFPFKANVCMDSESDMVTREGKQLKQQEENLGPLCHGGVPKLLRPHKEGKKVLPRSRKQWEIGRGSAGGKKLMGYHKGAHTNS